MDSFENLDHLGEVAVIGMAGRFPGAKDVDQFWTNLCSSVESISFFTNEDMEASGIARELYENPKYVKAKGWLEDSDQFDAPFFGLNPREAEIMDPQQRIFLECAWEALENAGYDSSRYKGRIGVFAGCGMNTYIFNILSNPAVMELVGGFQIMIANDKDFLPTIASYKLNLTGPSVNVQSACSTSLVAVHLACQSLLNGECDIALAGGVSMSCPPRSGYLYNEGDIHSPDGHCRAFDAKAQGTLDGEGVGIVVLKRLKPSLADRDRLCAVIKGSSINNDGSAKAGYTAPSQDGQAQVIAETLELAGVEPEQVSYIEAHGTGTALGDPIEVAALTQAFRAKTRKEHFCAIGSVKTNIGHLGAASGIAGFIKTVLCLQHRKIPPTLHFDQANPATDFVHSPFYVNKGLLEWRATNGARRAGVSSFGIGGTNAHVILEEAPVPARCAESRPWQLLLFSGRTEEALNQISSNLVKHLRNNTALNFPDVAYTLQTGRKRFSWRRSVVCQKVDDGIFALDKPDTERVLTRVSEADELPVVFMFPGGGAQYLNMGLDLYRHEAVFRQEIDRCTEFLQPILGLDIRNVIYPKPEESEDMGLQIRKSHLALPALFAVEYAMAKLFMSWGIYPSAMIGHSLGEYAAATLAGVFSLEDALSLVALRGKLYAQLPPGAMVSVSEAESEVRKFLGEDLSVAAINGPSQCVVSGAAESIDQFSRLLSARGIEWHLLQIDVAGHSEMVNCILATFQEFLKQVRLQPPAIPFISNVSGTWITSAQATAPEYWAKHLRETVRFREGAEALLEEGDKAFLEIGPGRTLSTLIKVQLGCTQNHVVLSSMRHPYDGTADTGFLLKALGEFWLAGGRIDWEGFYRNEPRSHETLPTYPFERNRYWIDGGSDVRGYEAGRKGARISKKRDIADWFYVPTWKESVGPRRERKEDKDGTSSLVLLFVGEREFGSALGSRLTQAGRRVITVVAGSGFKKLDNSTYIFDPSRHHEYADLIDDLLRTVGPPDEVVHLWNIEIHEGANYCDRGFYSLLFLAQALAKRAVFTPLRILAVTANLQDVTGEEIICPEKATILGPCEVIPQEYPNIRSQIVDIVTPPSGSLQEEQLLEALQAELDAEPLDPVIAYRGSHRWLQVFLPLKLREAEAEKLPWRQRGVYLITGGLGGVGLTFAEHLARAVHAKLILVGRTPFPPRGEWESLAEMPDQGLKLQQQLRRLLELEQIGAEVRVITADVAEPSQIRGAVQFALEEFGVIHGVIHAAGIIGEDQVTTILDATTANCEQQFRPKITGAVALEGALRGIELDFCVLVSSLSSVLGGLGYSAYSAANAFMNAFARQLGQRNRSRWVSVDSDIWQSGQQSSYAETWAQLPMSASEGFEAFQRALLLRGHSRVTISTGDLAHRLEQWINFAPSRLPGRNDALPAAGQYARPVMQNAYLAPSTDIERVVVSILEACLGIDQIGIHDNFFDLGGQSLIATRVVAALRDSFQVEISLRALFEKPTAAAMAKTIETIGQESGVDVARIAQLTNQISALSDDEAHATLAAKKG